MISAARLIPKNKGKPGEQGNGNCPSHCHGHKATGAVSKDDCPEVSHIFETAVDKTRNQSAQTTNYKDSAENRSKAGNSLGSSVCRPVIFSCRFSNQSHDVALPIGRVMQSEPNPRGLQHA